MVLALVEVAKVVGAGVDVVEEVLIFEEVVDEMVEAGEDEVVEGMVELGEDEVVELVTEETEETEEEEVT